MKLALLLLLVQAAFDTASLKPSARIVGHDGEVSSDPGRFTARNCTLKRLIFEAWRIPYAQIIGGPAWLNSNEFDVEARTGKPADSAETRAMLRNLLEERFHLAVRQESRTGRIYQLTVAAGGPHLAKDPSRNHRFHGTLAEFAAALAVQLTIPTGNPVNDPSVPSFATGSAIPVIDRSGITGDRDIDIDIRPEPGADAFTLWQRALREQAGLRLESGRGTADFLLIERVEKIPAAN